MSFNFMAAITICSDFGAQKIMFDTVSTVSPSIFHEVMGSDAIFMSFLAMLWNSAFRWLYLSFSPLPLACLLFSAVQDLLRQPLCLIAFLCFGELS